MNILLIDDHELFCEGMELILVSIEPRCVVRHATSMTAGLQLLATAPPPALILTDLQLPGVQGLQALHLLRQAVDGTPIVVLTGSEDPHLIQQAIECGAMGYIPKTVASSELARALGLILDGGVYLPATVKATQKSRPPQANVDLTQRQREVLTALIQGKCNKLIARDLDISESTVKTHVAAIFAALDVHSRTQAVYAIARMGVPLSAIGAPSRP